MLKQRAYIIHHTGGRAHCAGFIEDGKKNADSIALNAFSVCGDYKHIAWQDWSVTNIHGT